MCHICVNSSASTPNILSMSPSSALFYCMSDCFYIPSSSFDISYYLFFLSTFYYSYSTLSLIPFISLFSYRFNFFWPFSAFFEAAFFMFYRPSGGAVYPPLAPLSYKAEFYGFIEPAFWTNILKLFLVKCYMASSSDMRMNFYVYFYMPSLAISASIYLLWALVSCIDPPTSMYRAIYRITRAQ